MALRFGVLGPLEVWSDDGTVPLRGAKRRAVLAYLLVHAGEPQPPDRIVEAVWGEAGSSGSEATVQTYVSQLRKVFGIGGPRLVHRAGGYVLDVNTDALDASRFEAAVAAASGLDDQGRRLAVLEDALGLWRGVPLDEFAGQPWADDRARQWTRVHLLAHQLRAAALLDTGRHRDALPALEQLVTVHPLHEPFWVQLTVARYRSGQQGDALAAVSEARKVLATELGIEPGPELVELERKVLAHDPSLDALTSPAQTIDAARAMTVVEPLPDGVVTFMLTDIEGSTALWDQHPEDMAKALVRHEDVIADVVQGHGGRLLKSRGEGDATLSVFARATDAVAAAVALQRRLGNEAWPGRLDLPTRVALHTGEAQLRNGDYYGGTLNRGARIRTLASGGDVFLSRATHDLVVDVLASDLEFVGVGEHAMHGLQRTENVYAIRGSGFDLRPAASSETVIGRPRTSFVGRSRVVERVERALLDPGVVTLVGVGGIGKTRLALETATRVAQRFERTAVVELAAVTEPDDVMSQIAYAVGIDGPVDSTDVVLSALGREPALLVLDNCEHLVDECARVADELTAGLETLTVLATSRVPLELPGEVIVQVDPLAERDAVRVLLDRARRAEPEAGSAEQQSVGEIARRLDGIPLALELTGARLRSMSAVDLLARLPMLDTSAKRASTERHATMRAALDWSNELLSLPERALLRRLSVFTGFTLEAAERVTPGGAIEAPKDWADVAGLLGQLVLHSLVAFDETTARYRLLEPVREYAAELLDREGEDVATRDRHANYFADVAERVSRAMVGGQQSHTDLDHDHGNIEAALKWADERRNDETLCRIVGALGFFWFSTNAEQGVRWTERVVARQRDVPALLWASVLLAAGQLAHGQFRNGRYGEAWLDAAVSTYRDFGRTRGLAWALFWRGRLLLVNDPAKSRPDLEEALAKFRTRNDVLGIGSSLYFLGTQAYETDDEERYRPLASELSDFAAATRLPILLGLALERDALTALDEGDTIKALECAAAAVQQQRSGDRFNLAAVLKTRAWIESRAGRRKHALEALREALELGRRFGLLRPHDSSILVAAIVLIDAGRDSKAREVLDAAGFLAGPRFVPLDARWARERGDFIRAHLDLTKPIVQPFSNLREAADWILQWIAEELERDDNEFDSHDVVTAAHGIDARMDEPQAETSMSPRLSLIGRVDTMRAVEQALVEPGLITLVGPGGIGKTRLLETASTRSADRFERVWRIDLVAARDRAAVESLLEVALLPARDPMSRSADVGPRADLMTELGGRLEGRRLLVALDNCEQLVDFLPGMIESLLGRATGLTVLATSREPLGARGEIVIPVTPLALPPADAFTDLSRLELVESVELLVARARERGADLTVTSGNAEDMAGICRQLDGIPLAIELAAARLASTSVHDLAQRLPRQLDVLATRHGDVRHRTLRSAIDWSYELLEPGQQLLLRRLGIFMGGFTLEAAEDVCAGEPNDALSSPDAVYLNLAELVAKSLVIFDRNANRYRLLEPIRQFARQLLEASDEFNTLADQHAHWAHARARGMLVAFLGGDGTAADVFHYELDNVHAALDWLHDRDSTTFLRMVAQLGYAWFQTDWRRGKAVTEVAVPLAADASDRLRAGVLLARGMVEQRDDLTRSGEWVASARDIYLRIEDAYGVAWATFLLARSCRPFEPDEARRFFIEAAERFHELHVGMGETWALINLGDDAQDYGQIDAARAYHERARTAARESGATGLLGTLLCNMARTTAALGDLETARRQMSEAIDMQIAYGDTWNLLGTLSEAAWLDVLANDYESAESRLRLALRKGLELDDRWQLGEALLVLGVVRLRQKNHRAAWQLFAATGWDTDPPQHIVHRISAVYALALRELQTLDIEDNQEAAREGRALGVFGAARASLV